MDRLTWTLKGLTGKGKNRIRNMVMFGKFLLSKTLV